MNLLAHLTKRESQMAELFAWGATKKDIANRLFISSRTVENTARKIFEKTEVTKVNELSAWYFCSHFNISLDYSPLKKQIASIAMLIIVGFEIFNFNGSDMRVKRNFSRRSETEELKSKD